MKTLKTFQAAVTNNLTLAAVIGMAICTIAICCAFCNTENCDPCISLVVDKNPVCDGSSVGATSATTCDDYLDTVQVFNNLASPSPLNYDQAEEGALIWNGSVSLATGYNKLVATNSECGQHSSEVDVPCNGGSGSGWGCIFTPQPNLEPNNGLCGMVYSITVTCLPDGDYNHWEAMDWKDDPCNSLQITGPGTAPPITSSYGLLVIHDQNAMDCPQNSKPYYTAQQEQCNSYDGKHWILQNSVSLQTISLPVEAITMTASESTGLLIENSQWGTYLDPDD